MSNQSNDMPEGFKMTELGPLPQEWKTSHLGDVCQIQVGFPYDSEGFRDTPTQESVPIIRIRDLLSGEAHTYYSGSSISDTLDTYLVNKDDILIGMDGNFHVTRWKERRGLLNQRIARLKEFSRGVYWDYIYYSVITPIKTIENSKHYTTVKHLSMSDLRNLSVPLPPLPEQKAIARVLSTIQKAVEAQDKIISAARELKKSLMRHLFTYGPVPVAEAENVPLKETEIGPVPEHWEVKHLLDTATLQRGKDLPKQNQIPGQYLIVGSSGLIGYHNEFVCSGPGVVTGRSGSIGNLTYVEENYWPHNTGLYVKDFHGNNPKFTYYLLHFVDFHMYATGVSVPTLNRNFVHSALVPVPPTNEQQEIAYTLTSVDKKIEAEENRKATLQALFKTMLNQLMTGKIRAKDLEATAA